MTLQTDQQTVSPDPSALRVSGRPLKCVKRTDVVDSEGRQLHEPAGEERGRVDQIRSESPVRVRPGLARGGVGVCGCDGLYEELQVETELAEEGEDDVPGGG